MDGVGLPEGTSFRLLGLTFTLSMDWEPYIQSIANAASRKVGSLYRTQRYLTPESILYLYKSTIRRCMEYRSHIWGGAPRSHGLDLLDRMQTFVKGVPIKTSPFMKLSNSIRKQSFGLIFYSIIFPKCLYNIFPKIDST